MPATRDDGRPRGVVVAHVPHPQDHASGHERQTLLQFARRLAMLKGFAEGGFYDPSRRYPGPLYFVPASTLTSAEAAALGIHGPGDLFGGVVPHAFVGSKVLSHPLIGPEAAAILGWNPAFAARVGDSVLAGFSAFSREDAQAAGNRLLASGAVRVKPVRATGGRGQVVVRDPAGLERVLDAMDPMELQQHGLVLEEDLGEVTTISVGQVQVADLTASYFGFQKLTAANDGSRVFGGSDLTVVRGGFDALLSLQPPPEIRRAIEQAHRYETAVQACFPGFHASRSNYDILLGRDAAGRARSAVLEQSWRAGGATGPEIAALEAFRADPERRSVRTSGVEVFGPSPEPPPHATVYFRGLDPEVGWLTKYTVVEPDDDTR
jgi:hypothetical protein